MSEYARWKKYVSETAIKMEARVNSLREARGEPVTDLLRLAIALEHDQLRSLDKPMARAFAKTEAKIAKGAGQEVVDEEIIALVARYRSHQERIDAFLDAWERELKRLQRDLKIQKKARSQGIAGSPDAKKKK